MSLRPTSPTPDEARAQIDLAYQQSAAVVRKQLRRWLYFALPTVAFLVASFAVVREQPSRSVAVALLAAALAPRLAGLTARSRFFNALAADPELLYTPPPPGAAPQVPRGLTGRWMLLQLIGFAAPFGATALLLAAAAVAAW